MATFRLLRPADYRVMPWKNGLGTTTEIAIEPMGAPLDAFTFRLSIAELTVSGPFSTFPGYDRVILQIEGAPMTLTHPDRPPHRLALLAPYAFPGEIDTHGALEAPPARDFNVMVRRDRASAAVTTHDLSRGEVARAEGEAMNRIVHVLRGSATVERAGDPAELCAHETLLVEQCPRMVVQAGAAGAAVILIAIGPPVLTS